MHNKIKIKKTLKQTKSKIKYTKRIKKHINSESINNKPKILETYKK